VTLNSEEIKPVALAISELCLSEGINQSDSQSVENSVKYNFFKNSKATLCKGLELIKHLAMPAMLSQSKYLAGLWVRF